MLKNVTLTAYSAGVASTGKAKSHPEYGITASGTTVTEGRTIAVDPKVIPMGWWVYIEGIGFRRAEDTGSAVKGNKIDVYFESRIVCRSIRTEARLYGLCGRTEEAVEELTCKTVDSMHRLNTVTTSYRMFKA